MDETTQVPVQPSPPSPTWASGDNLLMIVLVISSVGSLIASLTRRQDLPQQTRKAAGLLATGLGAIEPFVPALRATTIDNDIRKILRAYSESDPLFLRDCQTLGVSPDDVADLIHDAKPELVGASLSQPPESVSLIMREVARDASVVKHGSPVPVKQSPHYQDAKDHVEQLLQQLRSENR